MSQTPHVHSRTEILADFDRLGGAQGLSLIGGMLPGGNSGAIASFLTACEATLKAGPVRIVIHPTGADAIVIEIK